MFYQAASRDGTIQCTLFTQLDYQGNSDIKHTSATGRSRLERMDRDSHNTKGISMGSDRRRRAIKMATENRRTS